MPRLAALALAAFAHPDDARRAPLLGDRRSDPASATAHPLPQERVDARRADPRRDRHRRAPVVVVAREEAGAPGPRRPADRRLILRRYWTRRAGARWTAGVTTCISADSHVTEPPDTYIDRIDPAFRDRAPRLHHDDTLGDVMLIDNGQSLVPYWLVAAAGRPADEVRLDSGRTFAELHRGGWDPEARARRPGRGRRERRGHLPVGRHAALQPSRRRLQARVLRGVQPVDRRVLRVRAGRDWSASARPRCARRRRASATSRRFEGLGLRGVMLPGVPPNADYDDPMYDEFWDAVVDIGLPPSFHILTSRHRHAVRAEHPRPEAEQLHVDPARQPGHRRHARVRGRVRTASRPARRVRRGRRRMGAALHVPRRPRVRPPPQLAHRRRALEGAERVHPRERLPDVPGRLGRVPRRRTDERRAAHVGERLPAQRCDVAGFAGAARRARAAPERRTRATASCIATRPTSTASPL